MQSRHPDAAAAYFSSSLLGLLASYPLVCLVPLQTGSGPRCVRAPLGTWVPRAVRIARVLVGPARRVVQCRQCIPRSDRYYRLIASNALF
ncbi:hypothetical protein FB451DRAFT_597870 [Mycena latifolia]|nr:hypothetical protein FB451DRAFT_597870 [Mycena latifolia]